MNPIYRFTTMDVLEAYIDSVQEISLDAETKGFDPHTKPLISLQIGDHENQYIIDCSTVDILPLKQRLESKTIIAQNCLPTNTEVLTESGWKNIKQVCLSDIVYGYDNGIIKKQNINGLIKTQGEVWNLHGKARSLRSTPNHRWIYQDRYSKEISYKTTEEVTKLRGRIILNGRYSNPNTKKVLTDDELRLFTWAITDGHITFGVKGIPGQIVITQSTSKPKFVNEIQALLDRLNIDPYPSIKVPMTGYKDCRRWYINAERTQTLLKKINYTKTFNYCKFILELSPKQLDIFIEIFNMAEGCESCEGDYTIGQSLKVNPTKRDAIALALYLKGYTVGFTKDVVSAKATTFMDTRTVLLDKEPVQDVYCLNTDLGNFVIRQNEQIFLTGNCKFDLKFFYVQGIYPRKIYDTFVAERVIYCGLPMMRASLDHLTERYCGINLDKSVRVDIPKEGLTPRVIAYAADDIKYLSKIKEEQLKEARKKELVTVINLENRFTPCLAYIEYCGFKLDAEKWKKKMEGDLVEMKRLEGKLDEWVMVQDKQSYIKQQLEFFEPQTCTINWNSPPQVAEFFEDLGLDCTVQEKGKVKKSVEAAVIQKYSEEHEIVKMYLEYKKAQKVVSTYGESFISQINEVTGRVHTNFKQVLDTGRISSGGKDSDRKVNLINFQNIPADPDTRACFVAEESNTLIICDYTQQEQVILANYSLDAGLLKFFDEGLGDMHSFVASLMYPELTGLSIEEIKTKHKDKRNNAKTAGFSINYGGVGATIAASQNISKEEGDKIYNSYFNAFPKLKAYFDEVRQQGLRDGYVLISPITKRKSYLPFYDRYKELEAVMTKSFWTKYREMKKEADAMYKEGLRPYPEFTEARKQVKDYFYYKGEIERKSLNFPIQGSSAETTKMSCIYIYDYILDNNLFGIVKFVNTIHDENVIECPVSMADKIAEVVGNAMVKSGKFFCKRVPLKAVPDLCTYWRK